MLSGIKLESKPDNSATSAMTVLEASTEQEAHGAVVNSGLIDSTIEAPSAIDVIVIDNSSNDDIVVL